MSSPVQLSDFIARLRQETDTENETQRNTDAFLTDVINRAVKHMHAQMIKCAGQGYFEFDSSFSTVIGQEFYPLPVQVMQVTKLWTFVLDVEHVMYGYEPTETEGLRPQSADNGLMRNLPRWRLVGNQVSLKPSPSVVFPISFRYKGAPPKLVAPTDAIDGVSGFDDFIIFWGARRVFMRDGRTDMAGAVTGDLQAVLAAMQDTVRLLNRSQPVRIADKRGSTVARHFGRGFRGRSGWNW